MPPKKTLTARKKLRAKAKATKQANAGDDGAPVPKSFVFHKGEVGRSVVELTTDVRRVLRPHTAINLKVRKSNRLKDFQHVAGPLGVTHMLWFSTTDTATNMRVARLPRGPTLQFRVDSFALIRDVLASQKNPQSPGSSAYDTAPLVVLNGMAAKGGNKSEGHLKLMSTILQNLFPAINVQKVSLAECKRVVLFDYDRETGNASFRHYAIKTTPAGVSRSVKKLAKGGAVPDLGGLEDVSQFVMRGADGYGSESEAEGADSRVTIEERRRGGHSVSTQQSVRLNELGPRLQLSLIKIEDGVAEGSVLYHSFLKKSDKEVKKLEARKVQEAAVREKRRKEQAANVIRKTEEKMASVTGQRKRKQLMRAGLEKKLEKTRKYIGNEPDKEHDDDAQYYRDAVGEEPESHLFGKSTQGDAKRARTGDAPRGGGRGGGRGGARGGGRGGGRGGSRGGGAGSGRGTTFARPPGTRKTRK